MEQRLSILTIGAGSLGAMRNFYVEKFGWKTVAENKDIVFFSSMVFCLSCMVGKKWQNLLTDLPKEAVFVPKLWPKWWAQNKR